MNIELILARKRLTLYEATTVVKERFSGSNYDHALALVIEAIGNGDLPSTRAFTTIRQGRPDEAQIPLGIDSSIIDTTNLLAWLVSIAPALTAGAEPANVGPGDTAVCGPVACPDIPGKIPRTAVGKLAIKAAWQIECDTKRAATAREVVTRLQEWADAGSEPATLSKSDKNKKAVIWLTGKGAAKLYDVDACGKALETWRKSCA